MLFNSLSFAAFFVIVLIGYWAIREHRMRLGWLLAASWVFYAAWYPAYLLLFAVALAFNFLATRALVRFRTEAPARARQLLAGIVVVDLALLGGFKYADFAVQSLANLLSLASADAFEPKPLGIFLPLGISFYTFQMIAYAVDVHRGTCAPIRNPLKFALFISFFPQLIAGPIVRANEFIDQLSSKRRFDAQQFLHGLDLIAVGLFKKVLIADQLAPFVDRLYERPDEVGFLTALIGVYAYSAQIYCDFSGYTDIGRGCAACLGFWLPRNFMAPYFSGNLTEFWRRWHITLSNWLRDYLYIPLGGNRSGRTYQNLFLTMALGGLWHGASWNFVIWGSLHGVGLALLRAVHAFAGIPPLEPLIRAAWYRWLAVFATFHFVSFAWIFFRAADFQSAIALIESVARGPLSASDLAMIGYKELAIVAAAVGAAAGLHLAKHRLLPGPMVERARLALARPFVYAAIAISVSLFASRGAQQFIYFQF